MRELDWTTTPFGPVSSWSPALRSAVGIVLNSRFPMVLYWGESRALIYNGRRSRSRFSRMARMYRSFSLGLVLVGATLLAACGGGNGRSGSARIAPATLTQIGVNSYLWRAALDTVSFAPIAQTDSAGGVIVTD